MAEKERIIGVLGTPGSGKTTLAKFLYAGEMPKPEEIKPSRNNIYYAKGDGLNKLIDKFNIRIIRDSKSHQFSKDYSSEIEILEICDIIIYLFNGSKLYSNNFVESKKYFKLIKKELMIYADYCKKNPEKLGVFLLIPTHYDALPEGFVMDEHHHQFIDEIRKIVDDFIRPYASDNVGGKTKTGSSLLNTDEANKLQEWIYEKFAEGMEEEITTNQWNEKIKEIISKYLNKNLITPNILGADINTAKEVYVKGMEEGEEIIYLWGNGNRNDNICLTNYCIYWETQNDKFFSNTSTGSVVYTWIKRTKIVYQTGDDWALQIIGEKESRSIDYITKEDAEKFEKVLDEIVRAYSPKKPFYMTISYVGTTTDGYAYVQGKIEQGEFDENEEIEIVGYDFYKKIIYKDIVMLETWEKLKPGKAAKVGDSLLVSLQNIYKEEIKIGMVLCSPGSFTLQEWEEKFNKTNNNL